MALDADNEIFIVHMAIKKRKKIPIYFEKQAQVEIKAQIETQV